MSTHPPEASRDRFIESLKRLHDLSDEIGITDERERQAQRARKITVLDEYPRGEFSLLFEVQPHLEVDNVWGFLDSTYARSLPRLAILVYHLDSVYIPSRQNGDKQPMFVDVVLNVYGPDGMIPSAIRAYLIEEKAAQFGRDGINCGVFLSRTLEPTFKFFEGLAHRELGAVIDDSGNEPSCCVPPYIVQSTIQIVDSVPQQESEIIECRRICELMYKSFCSELRVNLNSGNIGFMKRKNACFNVSDMLFGPLDLKSCALKWVGHVER